MKSQKKAFTFVELIISISILILISVIAITSLNSNSQKANNSRIESDSITLKNALLNYNQENKTLPLPNGNTNYFKNNSSYGHFGDSDNFGVYGSITEKTIPKKYLDSLPIDPVTNQYYSYGKTLDNKYFEIASILRNSESSQTKLDGTYPGEYGPISLIREYNGAFFISNQSQNHLPYNPDEHILVVTDNNNKTYRVGETITTGAGETKTLYFSDGSISELKPNSSLTISELNFKSKENNLLTTVKLFLSSGEIFTKATALNPEGSDFEIYTADTTAAVRGTIFSVSYLNGKTTVSVYKGEVEVQTKSNTQEILNPITPGEGISVQSNKQTQNNTSVTTINPTTKTALQIFADIFLTENQPVKIVSYVEPIEIEKCAGDIPKGDYRYSVQDNAKIKEKCNDTLTFDNKEFQECINITTYHRDGTELKCIANIDTIEQACSTLTINNAIITNNKYTATKNLVTGVITPLSKSYTYNLSGGECSFKCKTDFEWRDLQCKPIIQTCSNYSDDGFEFPGTKNNGETATTTKTEDITLAGLKIGERIYSRTIKCNGTSFSKIGSDTNSENITEKIGTLPIFAYAPYNNCSSIIPTGISNSQWKNVFKMSKVGGGNLNISTNFGTINDSSKSWKRNQMCRGEGFVIDNVGTAEYLKYSGLNLSGDFAFEIRAYIPSSNPGTTRYLFQLDDYQLRLNSDSTIKFYNGGTAKVYTSFNYNTYAGFQDFTAIKQGNTYTLKIGNTTIGSFTDSNPISSSASLYIGSSSNKEWQFNSVIDYVKIYK